MSSTINNYVHRLKRAYKQLENCRLVANRLITEATCAEFDAICNGCAPVDREEGYIVNTIRQLTKSHMGAYDLPELYHYAVAVGGLPLLTNLRVNDIAHLPFSTDEVFCRITAYRTFGDRTARPAPREPREQPSEAKRPLRMEHRFIREEPQDKNAEGEVSLRPQSKAAKWNQWSDEEQRKNALYRKQRSIPPMSPRKIAAPPKRPVERTPREQAPKEKIPREHVPKEKAPTEEDLANDLVGEKKSVKKAAPKKAAAPRKKMPAMMLDDFLDLKDDIVSAIDNPADKPNDKPNDKPADKSNDKQADKPADKPADLSKSWADMADDAE